MTNKIEVTDQLGWLARANLIYGVVGIGLLAQFGRSGSWRSFLAGWVIAFLNLELLKRIGTMILSLYESETKLPILFYVLLVSKFALWALILTVLVTASWIEGLPFLLGMSTLVVTAVGLGTKELVYARRT